MVRAILLLGPLIVIIIGHGGNSETRTIHVYDCPETSFSLCDFPGQDDTGGVNVEIANAVGMYNTLMQAESVRLVLVVDGSTVASSRGQVHFIYFQ